MREVRLFRLLHQKDPLRGGMACFVLGAGLSLGDILAARQAAVEATKARSGQNRNGPRRRSLFARRDDQSRTKPKPVSDPRLRNGGGAERLPSGADPCAGQPTP